MASFLDSVSDTVVSLINDRVYRYSRLAPDREHPFGHGGLEVISSLVQGMLLAGFGCVLLFQGTERLIYSRSSLDQEPKGIFFAAIVLFISAISGFGIQWMMSRRNKGLQEKGERSLSVTADMSHYLADGLYNAMSGVGILAVYYTGITTIDAAFGILGALFFIKTAFPIIKLSTKDILHAEVSAEKQQLLVDEVMAAHKDVKGIHRVRSRRLGPTIFWDFHLKLPAEMSLEAAHEIGEVVVRKIKRLFKGADVIIHLDPDNEPDDEFWEPSYKK